MSYLCPFCRQYGSGSVIETCLRKNTGILQKIKKPRYIFAVFVTRLLVYLSQNSKESGASVKELIVAFAFFR